MSRMLNRRGLLKAAGGLALSLPFLESAARNTARAQSAAPVRLLIFNTPNGFYRRAMAASGVGTGYSMAPSMRPIEDAGLRSDVLMLSGLDNVERAAGGDVHSPHAHLLVGGKFTPPGTIPGAVPRTSFDQVLASRLAPLGLARASVELSTKQRDVKDSDLTSSGQPTLVKHYFSWSAPTTYVKPMRDLRIAYLNLFGAPQTSAEQAKVLRRRSLVDAVLPETQRFSATLGRADQVVLEEYVASLREVERRLELPPATCGLDQEETFSASLSFPARVKLACDLMVLTFRCDRSRLITYTTDYETTEALYGFIPVPNPLVLDGQTWSSTDRQKVVNYLAQRAYHGKLSHWGTEQQGDVHAQAAVRMIDRWHVGRFAYLVSELKKVQEQGGSLLDNCAVLFTGALSNGTDHNWKDLPCILAGRGGGRITPGRHLRVSTGTAPFHKRGMSLAQYQGKPFSNLLVSLAEVMGHPLPGDVFGNSSGKIDLS